MATVTLKKNNRETIIIAESNFNGTNLVDIRAHYKDGNGALKPTRKGISIRSEQLEEFVAALSKFALDRTAAE